MKSSDLESEIQSCERCDLCGLIWNIQDLSKGYGKLYGRSFSDSTTFFLVGENPSYRRFPNIKYAFGGGDFVGGFGDEFIRILSETKMLPYCYITNLVKCSVMGNKINESHAASCNHWLMKEIEIVQPKVIVALGKLPMQYLEKLNLTTKLIKAYHPNYYISYNRSRINEYRLFWKSLLDEYVH